MNRFILTLENISKNFGGDTIFSGISFDLHNGETIAVTGRNGSGKSTLLKIIAGAVSQSEGSVKMNLDGIELRQDEITARLVMTSPYLNLYEEFTPIELLRLHCRLQGTAFDSTRALELIKRVNLYKSRNGLVRTFSSGMKQRVKFALSFMLDKELMLLDEPFTNLDTEGIGIIKEMTFERLAAGAAVIIATNDPEEKAMCSKEVNLTND